MTAANTTFAEAYASWLASVTRCCAPVSNCLNPGSTSHERGLEKPQISVVRDQPGLVKPPQAAADDNLGYYNSSYFFHQNDDGYYRPVTSVSGKERPRKSFSSTRTSFSLRRRLRASTSVRGGNGRAPLQISGPTNFRHVNAESSSSSQFPDFDPNHHAAVIAQPRRASFRPLQLSIYQPENAVSPLLPHFGGSTQGFDEVVNSGRVITPPPPARVRGGSDAESSRSRAMTHERSYSSMSFHLPRRGHPDDSPNFAQQQQQQTLPPPPPKTTRARAYTSPEAERLAERIASALLEKEKLQELIDECVERQSIYLCSRPSTAHSMAFSITGLEPMPAIPALPPTAPSFAERLTSTSDRPTTAPARSPMRPRHMDEPGSATTTPTAAASATLVNSPATSSNTMTPITSPSRAKYQDRPLQPPLPLVLRPPLRKKKSFSRVSTWLFPAGEQQQLQFQEAGTGLDAVTNNPRPVRGDEGFYQCLSPSSVASSAAQHPHQHPAFGRHVRNESPSLASDDSWETEDDDDERTMPTTWSPGSSPATKTADGPQSGSTLFDRVGSKDVPAVTPTRLVPNATVFPPRRESVGVAF